MPAESRPKARRELALSTLTLDGVETAELIDAAADGGFAAVTLRVAAAFPGENPPLASPGAIDEARGRLADRGLGVLDAELIKLTPGAEDAEFETVLDRAAALGAKYVMTVNDDPDEVAAIGAFVRVCELAAARGLRPALEFMVWRPTSTLERAYRIVGEAGHPAGAVLVDALHLIRSGGSPAAVAALVERSPGRFPYLQLCDAPAAPPAAGDSGLRDEALRGRLLPGEGGLPLGELLAAMPLDASISVEVPNEKLRRLPAAEVARRAAEATEQLLSTSS
jgi:sugar phosphate isomerase/epimerase